MGGFRHNIILKNDGTVWGAGNNSSGQLGLGNTTDKNTFTQVNISDVKNVCCGSYHTFLTKKDGTLWFSGSNTNGQAGVEINSTSIKEFIQIDIDGWKKISSSHQHTLLLKEDGSVWGSGYNSEGQLGLGHTDNVKVFTEVGINDVKDVFTGHNMSYILKNDGTLWSAGSLGSGLNTTAKISTFTKLDITDVKDVACGYNITILLKKDGTVWGTGNGGYLALGDDTKNKLVFTKLNIDNVEKIWCGNYHWFCLKKDGTLWGAGGNSYGQLGNSSVTTPKTPIQISVSDVKNVMLGQDYSLVLKNDGTLWVAGCNQYGQLSLGLAMSASTTKTVFTNINIDNVEKGFESFCGQTFIVLVESNGKYYSIDDSGCLVEIIEPITKELILKKGKSLDVISENLDILPNEFSLIGNIMSDIFLNGIHSASQMIIANNDFRAIIQENIDYFKIKSDIDSKSKIKIAFSIDSGNTWKTHDGNGFVDLNVTIPNKSFDDLSPSEKIEWDNSKSEILDKGIDANELETINFNLLNFETIRFAYVLSIEDVNDVAYLNELLWQFDSLGKMKKMKDSEIDIEVLKNGVEVTPLIDTEMIKINILPNGVSIEDVEIEFATDLDIEDLFK